MGSKLQSGSKFFEVALEAVQHFQVLPADSVVDGQDLAEPPGRRQTRHLEQVARDARHRTDDNQRGLVDTVGDNTARPIHRGGIPDGSTAKLHYDHDFKSNMMRREGRVLAARGRTLPGSATGS